MNLSGAAEAGPGSKTEQRRTWMGLFRKKKEDRPAGYLEENREKLEKFEMTKAWGIKKYAPAMQFIFDEKGREFVIVEGPAETFKEKNPDVISFDQAKRVVLEVDEYWTTGKGEFEPKPFSQTLTQDKYKDVYWRYDFYLKIDTDHPYAGNIRYKMNFKPTIMKVPQHGFIFHRGLEIGGEYEGEEIDILTARLEAFAGKEEGFARREKMMDIFLLRNKGKGSLESICDGLVEDVNKDKYLKKIANMAAHTARAGRITKLLLG